MRSQISRWIVETVKEAYTQADRQYDRVTHLHSLPDLYAATATTFLMKITWLLTGIFMYGTE